LNVFHQRQFSVPRVRRPVFLRLLFLKVMTPRGTLKPACMTSNSNSSGSIIEAHVPAAEQWPFLAFTIAYEDEVFCNIRKP
jgi:hypothetical protein